LVWLTGKLVNNDEMFPKSDDLTALLKQIERETENGCVLDKVLNHL